MSRSRVVVVDNYDSFTWNLVHTLEAAGASCRVVANDAASVDELLALSPDGIVVSPGPCEPARSGVSRPLVQRLLTTRLGDCPPLLGVCLGHQVLGEAAGGRVVRAREALHGVVVPLVHDGRGIFAAIPSPLSVARYNSLVLEAASLPACFETAACCDDEIMAIRHRTLPLQGIQFHPESFLCPQAEAILRHWLRQLPPPHAGNRK